MKLILAHTRARWRVKAEEGFGGTETTTEEGADFN